MYAYHDAIDYCCCSYRRDPTKPMSSLGGDSGPCLCDFCTGRAKKVLDDSDTVIGIAKKTGFDDHWVYTPLKPKVKPPRSLTAEEVVNQQVDTAWRFL